VPLLQLWVLWQPLAALVALAEATPDIPRRGRLTTMAMATKRTERRRIFTMTSLGMSMGQSDGVDPSLWCLATECVNIVTVDERGPGTITGCDGCYQSYQCDPPPDGVTGPWDSVPPWHGQGRVVDLRQLPQYPDDSDGARRHDIAHLRR
jgi:hypothetical protein